MKFNLIALTLVTLTSILTSNAFAEIQDPKNILGRLDRDFSISFTKAFKNERSTLKTEVCIYDFENDSNNCEEDKVQLKSLLLNLEQVELEVKSQDNFSVAVIDKQIWTAVKGNPIRLILADDEDLARNTREYVKSLKLNVKFNEEDSQSFITSYENITINHLGKLIAGVRVNLETRITLADSEDTIVVPFYYEFAKGQTFIKTMNKFDFNFFDLATIKFDLEE